jgi:glycosyltransferase involved in cell wall biosynthesis
MVVEETSRGPAVTAAARDRLRVLHVVVQAGPTNSQWNEHCLPAADEHRITVCSLFPATVAPDARIRRLEGDGTVLGALQVLRAALREDRHDVIHVHAPASAALLLGAALLEHRRVDNVLFTLHNSWPNLRRRNQLLATIALAAFPLVVACSDSAAASIPAAVRRVARRPVGAVPNGVDVERVVRAGRDARMAEERGAGVTVMNVGRLIPVKDHLTLLRAFAAGAGPDDRLVIVGEGPLRAELARAITSLGVADRVTMPGLLPRDEVYRMLAEADLYVSPSRGEGLPVSVLEALAAGLPAVLSDIAPHREVAAATAAALLVPVGDPAVLAGAIGRLRALSAEQRAALGHGARQAVTDRFSVRTMHERYRRVYLGLRRRTHQPIGAAA